MTNNSIIEWTDEQMTLLIKERKNKKDEYFTVRRSKVKFWIDIATIINNQFNTEFSEQQCRTKFLNLTRDYKVS
jgi:Myb/SANT-like DNA-binding protein